jgi:hypothetical protein
MRASAVDRRAFEDLPVNPGLTQQIAQRLPFVAPGRGERTHPLVTKADWHAQFLVRQQVSRRRVRSGSIVVTLPVSTKNSVRTEFGNCRKLTSNWNEILKGFELNR